MRKTGSGVLILAGALSLLPACAADAGDELAPAVGAQEEGIGMRIPVDFKPECAYLAQLKEAPEDLTVNRFFSCLTDDSLRALDRGYQKKVIRLGADAPASLAEVIQIHGDAQVRGARFGELVFGEAQRAEIIEEGIEPTRFERTSGSYGLDATGAACGKSCLSRSVGVVGATRKIGFSPAFAGPGSPPSGAYGQRWLDEVNPGTIPDFKQADLANDELVASGCGPVSAINLFEWWNIPIYNGSTELLSFNSRANYIAGRMDTLDGFNYTDDDELIDFVTQYPREQYNAGHTSGYPGYHYMRGNQSAWKVMMSYIARGYPVIALYSTGTTSLHWAAIMGYTDGKLRIANAGDRTLSDFYNQWDDWASLDWYADWGSDVMVDKQTFVALTGWSSTGTPQPERMVARTTGGSLPGYTASGSTYEWRYCVTASDEIGTQAENEHVSAWPDEPSSAAPGYCMFSSKTTGVSLSPSPSGGSAWSVSGTNLTLSVSSSSSGLSSFISSNPGVKCEFYGQASGGAWTKLQSKRCGDAGALSYTFANTGQYPKVTFHVHSPEVAKTSWNVTAGFIVLPL